MLNIVKTNNNSAWHQYDVHLKHKTVYNSSVKTLHELTIPPATQAAPPRTSSLSQTQKLLSMDALSMRNQFATHAQ